MQCLLLNVVAADLACLQKNCSTSTLFQYLSAKINLFWFWLEPVTTQANRYPEMVITRTEKLALFQIWPVVSPLRKFQSWWQIFVHDFLHNLYFHERYSRHHVATIGNLRKGDGDENGKKALGRIRLRLAKQLLCFHAFFYISSSSLYDYDVKLPYLTSCRTWTQDNDFLFLFRNFYTVFFCWIINKFQQWTKN